MDVMLCFLGENKAAWAFKPSRVAKVEKAFKHAFGLRALDRKLLTPRKKILLLSQTFQITSPGICTADDDLPVA